MKTRITTLFILLLCFAFPALAESHDKWDASTATTIQLSGTAAEIDGSGVAFADGVLTISASGTYVVRGRPEDGQILIDAGENDDVVLVLDGVTLSNSSTSPIFAKEADTFTLILAENSQNSISDTANYTFAEGEDEPDATIFSKCDMIITGSGSLAVTANFRNGIAGKDDLLLENGTIQITAVNDAIRGRDSLTITGGTYTIQAGNDGLKSNNDADAERGWVDISGGAFQIVAGQDGIQAETSLTISGGEFDITAGGGSENAVAQQSENSFGGFGGSPSAQTTTEISDDAASSSMKGLKAGGDILIDGGILTLNTEDDSVHSNGNVTVNGGQMTLRTGDDGIHADGALLITGGSIIVETSYEGLEGATVEITGSTIDVTASDDGINAAGGSDGDNNGRDAFRQGGSSDYWILISGGDITVSANGDGLDSNDALTIDGGTLVVHGPTNNGNGALDADGTILINGGTVLAAGSSGMGDSPSGDSAQSTLVIYYSATQQAGTQVTLKDNNGTILADFTAEKAFQMMTISLPTLQQGQTYTLNTAGQETTATLSATVTAINSDGSAAATNQRSGFGGGGGRGGMR